MRWAIDEISELDANGYGTTVGYVDAEDQEEAMTLASDEGIFGTGLYSARPAEDSNQ